MTTDQIVCLFDVLTRTSLGPSRETEPVFSYLNKSAEPYVQRIRDLIEQWFDSLPVQGHNKMQLRGRFRSKRNREHWGAVFELYCYTLLSRHGYDMVVEPVPDEKLGTRPDFHVWQAGNPLFYIECRLDIEAKEITKADARLRQVRELLNGLESPDFFLSMHVVAIGSKSLRMAPLKNFLLKRLGEVRYEDLAQKWPQELRDIVSWHWQYKDWIFEFSPIPKFAARGRPEIRTVGMQSGSAMIIDSRSPVRGALDAKDPKQYGSLEHPYIIAVNAMDQFLDETDVIDVLFGTEPFFSLQSTDVSAVLIVIVPQLMCWSVAKAPPVLWHNPFASKRLDPSLWKLPQVIYDKDKPELTRIAGCEAWELFGLEPDWPRRSEP